MFIIITIPIHTQKNSISHWIFKKTNFLTGYFIPRCFPLIITVDKSRHHFFSGLKSNFTFLCCCCHWTELTVETGAQTVCTVSCGVCMVLDGDGTDRLRRRTTSSVPALLAYYWGTRRKLGAVLELRARLPGFPSFHPLRDHRDPWEKYQDSWTDSLADWHLYPGEKEVLKFFIRNGNW